MTRTPGCLVLEDANNPSGIVFPGELFGAEPNYAQDRGFGEVVFNTSMTGYQEILTDPSYYGELVTMTHPHIGNTGVNEEDLESRKAWAAGFVVFQREEVPSNWRANDSLDNFLKKNGIPGIQGIDTRRLTLTLRKQGAVRGIILPWEKRDQATALLKKLPGFEGRDLIREVTTEKPYDWVVKPARTRFRVAALDFGMKWNQLRCFAEFGCEVRVFPATTTSQEILQYQPDGVFLTNGPGDPSAAPYAVKTVQEILGKKPVFGICMGHQILSLALGAKTYKLKFGHRGANHPVLDLKTQKVAISSQNHGYAVDDTTLPSKAKVSHINLNDKTVEGIEVPSEMAFSVQYHPEACPGPHDSMSLFEQFVDSMEKVKMRSCTRNTLNPS